MTVQNAHNGELVTVHVEPGTPMPWTIQVPSWRWRCETCEWTGEGLFSERAATAEAARHLRDQHHRAGMDPGPADQGMDPS